MLELTSKDQLPYTRNPVIFEHNFEMLAILQMLPENQLLICSLLNYWLLRYKNFTF